MKICSDEYFGPNQLFLMSSGDTFECCALNIDCLAEKFGGRFVDRGLLLLLLSGSTRASYQESDVGSDLLADGDDL